MHFGNAVRALEDGKGFGGRARGRVDWDKTMESNEGQRQRHRPSTATRLIVIGCLVKSEVMLP